MPNSDTATWGQRFVLRHLSPSVMNLAWKASHPSRPRQWQHQQDESHKQHVTLAPSHFKTLFASSWKSV